jgi:hypothetical protein
MLNGRKSSPYSLKQTNLEVPESLTYERFSMPFSIRSIMDASGEPYPMIFHPIKRCMTIFADGSKQNVGNRSIKHWCRKFVFHRDVMRNLP